MNKDLAALKEEFERYVAGVEAYRQSVTDAITRHDAECSADTKSLVEEVKAAEAKLPHFDPSANG